MSSPGIGRWSGWVVLAAAAVTTLVLAVTAYLADRAATLSATESLADVGVGVAFVLAAAVARGPLPERVWFASVGAVWLLASSSSILLSLPQAALLVALAVHPSGRVRSAAAWAFVAAGVAVAAQLVDQVAVVALFGGCALTAWAPWRRWPRPGWYVVGSASAVALALLLDWWQVRQAMLPTLSTYQAVLVAVAVAFAVVSHRQQGPTSAGRSLFVDVPAGLPGLQALLRSKLGDPDLVIEPGPPEADLSDPGTTHRRSARLTTEPVLDGGVQVATVHARPSTLADPAAAGAVAFAVRLTVAQARLLEEAEASRAALERSRSRLLASADRERERVSAALREATALALERAESDTREALAGGGAGVSALRQALDYLVASREEIARVIEGAPPVELGGGKVCAAIRDLAGRSTVPVQLDVVGDVDAPTPIETAVFYVCSESITNVHKHARASSVRIRLEATEGHLVLSVRDDGTGEVDPAGRGLAGLADRVRAAGGRLVVRGERGRGTTLVATLPLSGPPDPL